MWGRACDDAEFLITDQEGKATFEAAKMNEFGNQLKFQVKRSKDHMSSFSTVVRNGETKTLLVKPFVTSKIKVKNSNSILDSIRFYIGAENGNVATSLLENVNPDSLELNSVPDEENTILVYGYLNDSLVQSLFEVFYPKLDSVNVFAVEFE